MFRLMTSVNFLATHVFDLMKQTRKNERDSIPFFFAQLLDILREASGIEFVVGRKESGFFPFCDMRTGALSYLH